MNATQFARSPAMLADREPYRVITKIFGSLLGPEYIVSADGKTFRVGELTISQLKRGVPICDLDLLEVDPESYEAL
jgi:hypothetical protein